MELSGLERGRDGGRGGGFGGDLGGDLGGLRGFGGWGLVDEFASSTSLVSPGPFYFASVIR